MSPPSRPEALPRGVGVALVTIFDAAGRVDVAATAERAQRCVSRGMTSVLVAGTTGEPWRLDASDRIAIAGAVKKAIGQVPVLVGTGDPHAKSALETTRRLADANVADALLVLCRPICRCWTSTARCARRFPKSSCSPTAFLPFHPRALHRRRWRRWRWTPSRIRAGAPTAWPRCWSRGRRLRRQPEPARPRWPLRSKGGASRRGERGRRAVPCGVAGRHCGRGSPGRRSRAGDVRPRGCGWGWAKVRQPGGR